MKTIKLLTIGNSFARNALTHLESMAEGTDSVRFEVGQANLGGCSLERHSNLADFTGKHPDCHFYNLCEDESGEPVMVNLQEALNHRPWDVVTLQQVSRQSWRRETFEPYLDRLQKRVKSSAPDAEVLLHQTWAYRSDSPFLVKNCMTQEMMFERIRDNYSYYSRKYDFRIIPSGQALQNVRRSPERKFTWPEPDFDYHNPQPLELPRQEHSLAVGWKWNIKNTPDGIPSLRLDANHLNNWGCYLIGCVWFEFLTGMSIYESDFRPDAIDADTADFLREKAHELSVGRKRPHGDSYD